MDYLDKFYIGYSNILYYTRKSFEGVIMSKKCVLTKYYVL